MVTGVSNDATNKENAPDNNSEKKNKHKSKRSENSNEGEAKKRKIENASTVPEVSTVLSIFLSFEKGFKTILNFFQNVNVQEEAGVDEVLAAPLLKKDDYVVSKLIYNFGTRKEVEKFFVAQVEKLDVGRQNNQIKLKFLKKVIASKDDQIKTYFTFPSIPDTCSVSKDQISHPVNLKYVKRGRYYFEEFDMSNID